MFVDCYELEEVMGNFMLVVVKVLGLIIDCVVVGGVGDCVVNGIGIGVVNMGVFLMLIGMSGIMFVYLDKVEIDLVGWLYMFCYVVCGKWYMMGVSLIGGGVLDWFVNWFC